MLTVNTAIRSQNAAPRKLAMKFARYCSSRAALSAISARIARPRRLSLPASAADGAIMLSSRAPHELVDEPPRDEPRDLSGEPARDVMLPAARSGEQRHRERDRIRKPEQRRDTRHPMRQEIERRELA